MLSQRTFREERANIVDDSHCFLRRGNVIVTPPPCSPENWQTVEWPASQFIKGLPIVSSQVKELARRESLVVADAFQTLYKHQKAGREELTTEGIHLNQAGSRLMAEVLQQSWGYGRPLSHGDE